MCGITGVLTHDRDIDVRARELPHLIRLMANRGPDDVGSWTDGRHVALGFRRLAILDLTAAGHQPMVSSDSRFALVFNGELYNFRDLRRELEGLGERFRSRSDTEVVLSSLRTWGATALTRFNGMFALAFYDARERRLLLARDPIGVKPLFYAEHKAGLVFGTQFNQLLNHHFVQHRELDPSVLALYLRLGYIPPPYALFRDTHQVEPGGWVLAQAGKPLTRGLYYTFKPADGERLNGTAATEATAEVIEAAVVRQMVSDVPVGAFLSGGVDSPLVAAHMQHASASPVAAFTISSHDPGLDESAAASAYGEQLGLDHRLRRVTGADARALIDDLGRAYTEPFGDHSAIPTMLLSSLARDSVKVLLSGDGSDEVFWGYPRFRRMLDERKWFGHSRAVRAAAYGLSRYRSQLLPRGIVYRSMGEWYAGVHAALRTGELNELCPDGADVPESFRLFDYDGRGTFDDVAQWLRMNEVYGHLQRMLTKVDRGSMYYGVEVRVPFLDLAVLEHAAAIDPTACIGASDGKMVVRSALERMVRPETIATAKRGFTVPTWDWLRSDLLPVVRERLLDRDPYPEGFFSRDAVRSYVEGHVAGTDRTPGVWALLALQLWADAHLPGRAGC